MKRGNLRIPIPKTRKTVQIAPSNPEDSFKTLCFETSDGLAKAFGCSAIGHRATQEDRFDIIPGSPESPIILTACVFDGHSGAAVVEAVRAKLAPAIIKAIEDLYSQHQIQNKQLVANVIAKTFVNIDNQIEDEISTFCIGGSTVAMVIVMIGCIIVCNLGDSGICADGKLISQPHNPWHPIEKIRLDGMPVIQGRIFGSLAVSRSMGDYGYKKHAFQSSTQSSRVPREREMTGAPFLGTENDKECRDKTAFRGWPTGAVSNVPYIQIFDYETAPDTFVIASDGFFEETQDFDVNARLLSESETPEVDLENMIKARVRSYASRDNITAIFLKLPYGVVPYSE
jgi:serine/threonine protein phosphatase PrpC